MAGKYRFSFGPWNIHEGADPFGPTVRPSLAFSKKLKMYRQLGFDAVQFHDDDAVPDLEGLATAEVTKRAAAVKKMLDDEGLVAEFVAPRLWEHANGIDGGYTANDPNCRRWAIDRSKRAIDVANALGAHLIVLWLAREGTYIRESKNPLDSHRYLIEALNEMLRHDPHVEIAIEPKPNEPMDHAYIPTIGHALAIAHQTVDPNRVGGLIETAHALLAGLDPSDEMAFALSAGKLWSVHLNDQNGLKYDQDKSFAAANLRGAFNQVRVLELANYPETGRFIGLDVKAMRTQKAEVAEKHLANSRELFLLLIEKVRSFSADVARQCIANRDYEALELLVLKHLMGK
jgi:xylose isomerase